MAFGSLHGCSGLAHPSSIDVAARLPSLYPAYTLSDEEGLKVNPWDPQLGTDVGDACRELGYQECAVFSYE